MRKVVYTFIFGNYDTLKAPTRMTRGWDYICFTDNTALRSSVWDIRRTKRNTSDFELDDKRFASKHKILFQNYLSDYDLSISVAGNVQINCDLDELVKDCFAPNADLMVCRHPDRDCVYAEAAACKLLGKGDPRRIDDQMQRYREAGYPDHNGLYENAVIGRRHGRKKLEEMCALWFQELARGSDRDQLSLPYVLWLNPGIQISQVDFRALCSDTGKLIVCPHLIYGDDLNPFHDCARFDNGFLISQTVVSFYLTIEKHLERWPRPELAKGANTFFSWMNAPAEADPCKDAVPAISNLEAHLFQIRPDVRAAYPDLFGEHRRAFVQWCLDYGSNEHRLPWLKLREDGPNKNGLRVSRLRSLFARRPWKQ